MCAIDKSGPARTAAGYSGRTSINRIMSDKTKVETLFEAWKRSQQLEHAVPTWALIQEAFETGWQARGLEPDLSDASRRIDSLLHSLIRIDPERAKFIIRKLS